MQAFKRAAILVHFLRTHGALEFRNCRLVKIGRGMDGIGLRGYDIYLVMRENDNIPFLHHMI